MEKRRLVFKDRVGLETGSGVSGYLPRSEIEVLEDESLKAPIVLDHVRYDMDAAR